MSIKEIYQNNKKKMTLLFCAVGLVVIIFAIVLLTAPMTMNKSQTEMTAGIQLPSPILVTKDGQIYLISADNSVPLGVKDEMCTMVNNRERINGMLSHDNTRLYYLKGYDKSLGSGDLLTLDIQTMRAPVLTAKNVFCAVVSDNGNALYLSNVKNGAGDLYYVSSEGNVTFIDNSVVPEAYDLSPDGDNFFYVKKSGDQYAWCLKCGVQSVQVVHQEEPKAYRNVYGKVDNAGRLLFGLGSSEADTQFYLFDNGQSETIDLGQGFFQPYTDEDDIRYFLCQEIPQSSDMNGSPLYFVGEDQKVEKVSDNSSGVYDNDLRFNGIAGDVKFQWLYAEQDETHSDESSISIHIIDGDSQSISNISEELDETNLAENKIFVYSIDEGSQYICNASAYAYCSFVGSGSAVLIFDEFQAPLSLVRKLESGWSKPEVLSEAVAKYITHNDYVYWIDQSYELWRAELQTGQKEKLLDKVMDILISGDTVYICVDNHSICRLENGDSIQLIDANSMIEAANGVLVQTEDGKLIYFQNGKDTGKTVMEGLELSPANFYGIKYALISDEDAAKLKELREDAVYYLNSNGMLYMDGEVISSPHRSIEEDLALAQSYACYGRLPNDLRCAAGELSDGFSELKDGTNEVTLEDDESFHLLNALSMLDSYLNGE